MMRIRLMKMLLVVAAGLQALFYGLQNIVNIDQAYGFVESVMSMEGHEVYPNSLIGPVTEPTVIWLTLGTIIFLEIFAGMLALIGAVRMSMSHNGTVSAFNASKRAAIIGLGLMLLVWLGMFLAIGGALFQMWQTPLGQGSLNGAFIYATTSGLVLAIITQPEPPHADRVPHERQLPH
jgi:predicted small integral membrane protein